MLSKTRAQAAQALLRAQAGKTFDFLNVTGAFSVYEKDGRLTRAIGETSAPILHFHTRANAFNPGHVLLHEGTVIRCEVREANGEGGLAYSTLEIETVPVSSMGEWLTLGGYDWLKKEPEILSETFPLSGLCGE